MLSIDSTKFYLHIQYNVYLHIRLNASITYIVLSPLILVSLGYHNFAVFFKLMAYLSVGSG